MGMQGIQEVLWLTYSVKSSTQVTYGQSRTSISVIGLKGVTNGAMELYRAATRQSTCIV